MPAIRCNLEDERRNTWNDAVSSKSWNAYSEQKEDAPVALQESELELTLALGCLAGKKVAKKETSSSMDSRMSNSSSSTESVSPDYRVLPSPSLIGSVAAKSSAHVGSHLECPNLAR